MNLTPAFVRRRFAHRPGLLRILDNIGWLFFDRVLRMGVGLIVGIWLARYLGPDRFGALNFAIAFVTLFGAIAGLGLKDIVVRDIVREPQGKDETLGSAALLLGSGGLLAYGGILGIIFWLRPEDTLTKMLVAIIGSTVLFKFSDVAACWFESQVLSKYIVWVQNGSFLVLAAIKVALILNDAPLVSFAWAIMAEALMGAILMFVMLAWRGPALRQLRVTLGRAKGLLTDSWPLLLSGIAILIYMKIDQIMLGQMVGNEAVGIYSAAVRLSEVWYFIPVMIVTSVFPAILQARERSEAEYYRGLQRLYDLMVLLSLGLALPMTFLSTPVVTLLFGDAFAGAGTVLAIHIWAAVFVFLGVASGKWFVAENRQILSLRRTALGAVANVALNLVLIPDYGPIGAAIATVLSYAIASFLVDVVQQETRQMFYMKVKALNLVSSLTRARRWASG